MIPKCHFVPTEKAAPEQGECELYKGIQLGSKSSNPQGFAFPQHPHWAIGCTLGLEMWLYPPGTG